MLRWKSLQKDLKPLWWLCKNIFYVKNSNLIILFWCLVCLLFLDSVLLSIIWDHFRFSSTLDSRSPLSSLASSRPPASPGNRRNSYCDPGDVTSTPGIRRSSTLDTDHRRSSILDTDPASSYGSLRRSLSRGETNPRSVTPVNYNRYSSVIEEDPGTDWAYRSLQRRNSKNSKRYPNDDILF